MTESSRGLDPAVALERLGDRCGYPRRRTTVGGAAGSLFVPIRAGARGVELGGGERADAGLGHDMFVWLGPHQSTLDAHTSALENHRGPAS